ncbi:hypothetical protein D3C76_1457660 [compost metagenome]
MVMLGGGLGHFAVSQRRTILLQIAQPTQEPHRLAQCRAAAQQITQRRKVQHRAVAVTALEVRDPQPAGVLRPGQGHIQQA